MNRMSRWYFRKQYIVQALRNAHTQFRWDHFSHLFCLMLALVMSVGPSLAETIVSGEVSGVWDTDGSPYLVTDTLIVPEGDTLLIEPGVTVEFQDQDSLTCFPFYVEGCLLAHGEEGDSVYFNTDSEFPFRGFIMPEEAELPVLSLKYAVVDHAVQAVDAFGAITSLSDCIIITEDQIYDSHLEGVDTLLYNEFVTINNMQRQIRFSSTASGEFAFNTGVNVAVSLSFSSIDSIHHNDVLMISLAHSPCEIYANDLVRGIWGEEGEWHDNIFTGHVSASGAEGSFLNNTLAAMIITNSDIEIGWNQIRCSPESAISELINLSGGSIDFHHNIIDSPVSGISIYSIDEINIYNNTFIFREVGVYSYSLINCSLYNNIFIGDGISCIGIQLTDDNEAPDFTGYNCFFDVTLAQSGFELDEGNLFTNPYLAGGDPFEYTLQANSPCIDAGNPDSPNDPDNTRADIGCYYYDQSIDNPPVQTIPEEIFAQTGQLLRIQITATDDNGPFDFTFPDLPEWLSEEDELDWVSDTTAVSGTVPEDAEDFSFTVIVGDGEGQTDSSIVTVDVDQRTLLSGVISGILHVEDSPFYIVDDIVVPEGDSLVIEPGCELQFRFVEDEEQRIGLICQGRLVAEGTYEDSIYFHMAQNEAVYCGWDRVQIAGDQASSSFKYVYFSCAFFGIHVTENAYGYISKYKTGNSRVVVTGAQADIDSSYFYTDDNCRYVMIDAGLDVNISIKDCVFEDDSITPISKAINLGYGEAYLEGNQVYGTQGVEIGWYASPTIVQNIFCESGIRRQISIANYARMNVLNNLFLGLSQDTTYAIETASITDSISNNVFSNFQLCIYLHNWEDDDTTSPVIRNNVFMNSQTGIHSDLSQERIYHTEYNVFWNVDTPVIDCPFDQTNLIVDPLFADTAYHLYDNSPLIDAGYPGNDWFDTDSTRNDIGLWGGPYGESYEYPLWVIERSSELPEAFRIFAPYPNPFNSIQHIHLALPVRADVSMRLYNIIGQEVFQQQYPVLSAGYHQLSYNACNLASGMYFLEVHAGKEVKHTRVVLVK